MILTEEEYRTITDAGARVTACDQMLHNLVAEREEALKRFNEGWLAAADRLGIDIAQHRYDVVKRNGEYCVQKLGKVES